MGYQDRREDIAGGTSLQNLMQKTMKLMDGGLRMEGNVKDREKGETYNTKTLVFPVLEMFYWRRVVFDEFHELECFNSEQQVILQHMRSFARWGLTGTPPVDNIAGVLFLSSLF